MAKILEKVDQDMDNFKTGEMRKLNDLKKEE